MRGLDLRGRKFGGKSPPGNAFWDSSSRSLRPREIGDVHPVLGRERKRLSSQRIRERVRGEGGEEDTKLRNKPLGIACFEEEPRADSQVCYSSYGRD